MYGGRDYINRVFHPGVWIFDTNSLAWERHSPEGWGAPSRVSGSGEPTHRTGHAAICHTDGIAYFGGLAPRSQLSNDVPYLDLSVARGPTSR